VCIVNRLAVLLVGAFFFGAVAAAPAVAQTTDSCDEVVVDSTDQQVLKDRSDVLNAANALESMGAEVRIRALQTVPHDTLSAYKSAQSSICSSWREPNGDMLKNLIVFIFSIDGQDAIFYGEKWHGALHSKEHGIRLNNMDPQFRGKYYAEGLVDAQNSVASAIHSYRTAQTWKWIAIIGGVFFLLWVFYYLTKNDRRSSGYRSSGSSFWFFDSSGGDSGGGGDSGFFD
jgi:uncharacterized membrane protein YgcG